MTQEAETFNKRLDLGDWNAGKKLQLEMETWKLCAHIHIRLVKP